MGVGVESQALAGTWGRGKEGSAPASSEWEGICRWMQHRAGLSGRAEAAEKHPLTMTASQGVGPRAEPQGTPTSPKARSTGEAEGGHSVAESLRLDSLWEMDCDISTTKVLGIKKYKGKTQGFPQ